MLHGELWCELLDRWLLLRDNVGILWALLHVGQVGNGHAGQQETKGPKVSLQQLTVHKTRIRTKLGLEEMLDESTGSDVLGKRCKILHRGMSWLDRPRNI